VPVKRLDQVLPMLDISAGNVLCKVDTQGYDMEVLAGAGDYIRQFSAILTEVAVKPIYENMKPIGAAIEQLRTLGFEVVGLYPVAYSYSREGYLLDMDCLAINSRHRQASQA
jgi:hypothetical protein